MKNFEITITERLIKTVEVEAENYSQAVQIVRDRYFEEDIVLTADDYFDTEFD